MNQRLLFVAACMLLFGCNNQSGQVTTSSNESDSIAISGTITPVDPSIDPANLLPDSTGNVPTPVNDPANIKVTDPLERIDITSKLNPAHGQPGHRCDVPVGASLSGLPKAMGMSLCKNK